MTNLGSRGLVAFLFLLACLPAAAQEAKLDRFGGCEELEPAGKSKGFFRVEKIGERYWFVTPSNNPFWSVGCTVVQWQDGWGGRCPKLDDFFPNPFAMNAKYEGKREAWQANMHRRFRALGWNTEAAWGVGDFGEIPECVRVLFISGRARAMGARTLGHKDAIHTTFVDVFDPAFEKASEALSKQLEKYRESPWVIGAFPDNEITWEGLEKKPDGRGLPDEFIAWEPEVPGKKAWVEMLQEKYKTISALNKEWGKDFAGWDAVAKAAEIKEDDGHPQIFKDKVDFMRKICDQYYRVTTTAMRKADPNHLVFSARFALWGGAFEKTGRQVPFHEVMWEAAGKYCDVIAVNCYHDPATLQQHHQYFTRVFEKAKKPICITEWAVIARDSHFEKTNGWMDTQAERAQWYVNRLNGYMNLSTDKDPNDGKKAFFCMGAHWFQLYDEPPLGRTDGEHTNFGTFTCQDEPFLTFQGPVATFNRQIYSNLVKGEPIRVLPPPEASVREGDKGPTLDWKPVEGAEKYNVLCSPYRVFPGDGMTLVHENLKGPGWSMEEGFAQGTWYVCVQGVDGAGRGGYFCKPVEMKLGPPAAEKTRDFFKFDDLGLWRNLNQDGPGHAVAFLNRDRKLRAEGAGFARVIFTPLSYDRAAEKPNEKKARVAWSWAGKPLECKRFKPLEFRVRPHRVCSFPTKMPEKKIQPANGEIYPSTKFLMLRLADGKSGKELVHPVDPAGTMKPGEWHRVKVDIRKERFERLDAIEWLVECSHPQTPWEQRIVVDLDDFSALPFED